MYQYFTAYLQFGLGHAKHSLSLKNIFLQSIQNVNAINGLMNKPCQASHGYLRTQIRQYRYVHNTPIIYLHSTH